MELRQLRYFLAVAEELHFGRAAARLHVSQPPLSVAVKSLEKELGATLFERTSRRVALTPEGEAFRARVQELLEGLDAAVAELSEVHRGILGRLRIGYVSSASYSILPRAVHAFQGRFPQVELTLSPLTSAEQLAGLAEGRLDVGIVRDLVPTPGVRREHVLSEGLVAVLPERHRLASHAEVPIAELVGEPLVLFPAELMPGYLARITEALESGGATMDVVQRTVHQETVLGLVAAGVGLSILPESVARLRMPGVVARPLDARPTTELSVVWHGAMGAAARAFADHVLEAGAEPLPSEAT